MEPVALSESIKVALIKYLSNDIASIMDTMSMFRTGIVFFMLIGPFILLSSLTMSKKSALDFESNNGNGMLWLSAILSVLCYLYLGLFAMSMEVRAWDYSDQLRDRIVAISLMDTSELSKLSSVAFKYANAQYYIKLAYAGAFFTIFVGFIAVVTFVRNMKKKSESVLNKMPRTMLIIAFVTVSFIPPCLIYLVWK